MTPMQEQHNRFKEAYPDALLLFRLGDFYEIFDEDAHEAAKILGITLTARGKGENRRDMAGIPHHALKNYLPKLIDAGVKVAIADQIEEPVPGKLVERDITKVITPGTITETESLKDSENNFIMIVAKSNSTYYGVYADISTGGLVGFKSDHEIVFFNEIQKIAPAEVLYPSDQQELWSSELSMYTQALNFGTEITKTDTEKVKAQLGVNSLIGFGIDDDSEFIPLLAAFFDYVQDTQKRALNHLQSFRVYQFNDYMQLDTNTIANLELLYPISHSASKDATLIAILDDCKTPMGKRFIRQVLLNPIKQPHMLEDRLSGVDFFFGNPKVLDEVRENLRSVYDIQRITSRVGMQTANPKDFVALKKSLEHIVRFSNLLSSEILPTRLQFIIQELQDPNIADMIQLIDQTIAEDPPVQLDSGYIVREGYNEEVDDLRNVRSNSQQILADIQTKESETHGIPSLKVSFNKVFGYYIEVTKTHVEKVPDSYIRKQTLANAERYITQELKVVEEKILNSEEALNRLEYKLFVEFREAFGEFIDTLHVISERVAEIDVISNFAHISRQNNYTRPEFVQTDEAFLILEDSRHPVVEKLVDSFTENSVTFTPDTHVHILTGPNMSGKSTYIRQVALNVLMAQIGCYVPARSLQLSIFDRIFTRVGASDNLSKGESTFMVEMAETANILNNATNMSLVILDEVGRGTSTFDGVAIAWSMIEYILSHLQSKTLFATHYHELTDLAAIFEEVENHNVLVREENDDIHFTHQIVPGGTSKSYGIHVAKLAGVPSAVVDRAHEILRGFESDSSVSVEQNKQITNDRLRMKNEKGQSSNSKEQNQNTKNTKNRAQTKKRNSIENSKPVTHTPKLTTRNPVSPRRPNTGQLGFF